MACNEQSKKIRKRKLLNKVKLPKATDLDTMGFSFVITLPEQWWSNTIGGFSVRQKGRGKRCWFIMQGRKRLNSRNPFWRQTGIAWYWQKEREPAPPLSPFLPFPHSSIPFCAITNHGYQHDGSSETVGFFVRNQVPHWTVQLGSIAFDQYVDISVI